VVQGRAVQVDPIKPKLKPLGTERLKLTCDVLLSTSAFKFNLRRYNKERVVRGQTLGSLLVVLLIRTVKYNLSKLRDVYLHTNCLAAGAYTRPLFRST